MYTVYTGTLYVHNLQNCKCLDRLQDQYQNLLSPRQRSCEGI